MTTSPRPASVHAGRLPTADLVATLLVATAVVVAVLWLTDVALTSWSTRVVSAVVLALGYLACTSTQARMVEVYGAQGRRREPLAYVVGASALGAVALVSGVVALVWAAESMLWVLVVSTVALWAISTAWHLVRRPARPMS